ncbi:unnamed protein product [Discosporangium mesarthrocarpum]
MGRVRRYKKIKSIDPFSKQKAKKNNDLDRNLPPDVKNHQAQRLHEDGLRKKKFKRQLPKWVQEEVKATAKSVRAERDDISMGRIAAPNSQAKDKVVIEGKRPDESLRQFNNRVRGETTMLLKEEHRQNSSTNKRRKRFLQDRKQKQELKRQGLWEEAKRLKELRAQEEDQERAAKEWGQGIRGKSEGGKHSGPAAATGASPRARLRGVEAGGGRGGSGGHSEVSFPAAESIRFGEVAHAPPDLGKMPRPRGLKVAENSKPWARERLGGIDKGGEGQEAQRQQMEMMRLKVQEAYEGLKKRRRAGQTHFAASDL